MSKETNVTNLPRSFELPIYTGQSLSYDQLPKVIELADIEHAEIWLEYFAGSFKIVSVKYYGG